MLRARADNSTENERELEWTEFNKPSKITRNGKTVEFYYDANHNRYLKKNSDGIETFYFGKTYERVTDTNTGIVQHKHFIYADGKLIALNTQTKEADNSLKDKQVRYLHYDALNSVDMITDGYGLVVERRSYDTWGKKRNVLWREDGPLDVVQAAITNRGYTGHEEIVEVDLVHMNGRVYDQELGRFISPDPIIQAPYVTNSFNRYAYVMNNPLKYTDPTGYFWEGGSCNTDGTMRDRGGRVTGRWDRDRDRNRNTPATPPRTKPKVKEEEVPKVEPTVEPPSQKYKWGNEDLAGEMDQEVRNEALRDTMDSLIGVEDFVDAAETVLDANATIADKVVAVGGAFAKRTPLGKVVSKAVTNSADKWSRTPKSIQDQMTLKAAQEGQGNVIIKSLNDPKFKGMEKMELKVKSANGNDSVVHYVRDPNTGNLMDFKFKKHNTDGLNNIERVSDPRKGTY